MSEKHQAGKGLLVSLSVDQSWDIVHCFFFSFSLIMIMQKLGQFSVQCTNVEAIFPSNADQAITEREKSNDLEDISIQNGMRYSNINCKDQ